VADRWDCSHRIFAAPRPPCAGRLFTAAVFAAVVFTTGGCAHTQRYQLDCVPRNVTIYLDKVPLERTSDSVDLRADRPHVFFFKGEGYESMMVVLDTEETPDGPVLSPSDLCSDFELVKRSRNLQIEVE